MGPGVPGRYGAVPVTRSTSETDAASRRVHPTPRARRFDEDPERRLLRAVGDAVANHGYAATTVNHIVALAHVSKRTFYERYAGKAECFLESYRRGSDLLNRRLLAAGMAATGPCDLRLRLAMRGYLSVLVEYPASTRTFTLEILSAGPEALELRREKHRRTAATFSELVDDIRRTDPTVRPLSAMQADAMVGAITELILNGVAAGRATDLMDLDVPVVELFMALLTAPPRPLTPLASAAEGAEHQT